MSRKARRHDHWLRHFHAIDFTTPSFELTSTDFCTHTCRDNTPTANLTTFTTPEQVTAILSTFNLHKASPTVLPRKMLAHLTNTIAPILSRYYNMHSATIPPALSGARLASIHKSGSALETTAQLPCGWCKPNSFPNCS
eukprot:6377662-Amphidinium_carterae.1